jgi:hypothetical protein
MLQQSIVNSTELPLEQAPGSSLSVLACDIVPQATPSKPAGPKRGPVAKRRFQKGRFEVVNGAAYTLYYEDVPQASGLTLSRRARRLIGRIGVNGMSQRSALREHQAFMQTVNLKRGSVAPAVVGRTFEDMVNLWRNDVAPHLATSTLRQRESHLRQHILPKFGKQAPHTLTVPILQQFATALRQKVSRKTVVQVLVTISGIQKYVIKHGVRAVVVSLKDLEIGRQGAVARRPFFTKEQVGQIIGLAKEPYQTMFTLAWCTGLRAGEILALSVDDLDFASRTNHCQQECGRQQPKDRANQDGYVYGFAPDVFGVGGCVADVLE